MDGGIHIRYTQYFGWQERLQEEIRERHHGKLLVGQAETVETDHPDLPFLLAAPTMRVPMIQSGSVNPYFAARAALLLVNHGTFGDGTYAGEKITDYVNSIVFPSLGVGRIGPNTCAYKVRAAIEDVLRRSPSFPVS